MGVGIHVKCAKARRWLSRKIDGELAEFENRELTAHLARCASCTREYGLMALPGRIAREIPPLTPSPFFHQRVRARIQGEEARSIAGWQIVWRIARQMIPALAGITLALLSVFAYLQVRDPDSDIYRAYEGVLLTEEQPHRMLLADQVDITDASVLRAIAESESSR
jgi:anti-sigma factor RsiW